MINLGRCRLAAAPAVEVTTRAVDVVRGSPVVDMLSLLTLDWPKLFRWQRRPAAFGEDDYRLLGGTGIELFHPAVETGGSDPHEAALRWMAGWNRLLRNRPCFLKRVDSVSELLATPGSARLGVLLGFQDSDHFRTVDDVERFHRLGQRVSQLTYNGRNRLGSGCRVPRDRGLTAFGADVVAAMNRLGMAVDVSHCGDRTALDAVEASGAPVLVTHSNCRALVPGQPRCRTDDLIRALAPRGGVMGITVVRAFVSPYPRPTLDDLLDHFDHVARLVGVEHVGLGTDLDADGLDPATGGPRAPYVIRGLDPQLRVFQIAEGLLRRGYSRNDVELVLGRNFRRVLYKIWGGAADREPDAEPARRDPFCPPPPQLPTL